jgi:hypothetical protein
VMDVTEDDRVASVTVVPAAEQTESEQTE